jgi:cytochrome c peroxidase
MQDYQARDRWVMQSNTLKSEIAAANEIDAVALDSKDISDLVAFLQTLTDPAHRDATHLVPERVPSGLPIDN